MAEAMLDTRWQAAFPTRSRPQLYSGEATHDGEGFRPLSDASDFLVDNLSSLTRAQIYALAENNALALRLAQEEWTELERIAQQIKSRDALLVTVKDPQLLPTRDIFEERKEAALYGYKYEANRKILPARFTIPEQITDQEKIDCREPPEPFLQGGLIPNEKQYKSIMVAARNAGRENNPDDQKPYDQNFAFEDRTSGMWIAKTLAPEQPPPPRTRARNAILNGSSERQTRFNGEKVPMTREVSSNGMGATSPAKGANTPVGVRSPATGKRKIDATDITAEIPRKRHPNQYTKAREERERLAREAALRATGVEPHETTTAEALAPVPMKKKHPNQYTKRREREEEERRKKEEEQVRPQEESSQAPQRPSVLQHVEAPRPYWHTAHSHHVQDQPMANLPLHTTPYGQQSLYQGTYTVPDSMPYPQYSGYSMYNSPYTMQQPLLHRAPERPKHPNQHTKRREREAAAAAAVALEHVMSGTPGPPPGVRMTPSDPVAIPYAPQLVPSRQSTPSSQQQVTSHLSTKGRDPTTMTKEELLVHPFKDKELIALLEVHHAWLNEDPEKAELWKKRILASDYPVRTWAMFRKWREWRSDGKDKRPRDKDGKRIKQAQSNSVTAENITPNTAQNLQHAPPEDVAMLDNPIEPQASNDPPTNSGHPGTLYNGSRITRKSASPMKSTRPFITRLDTGRNGSSFSQTPGSPLVNGINARDLDNPLPSPSTAGAEAIATSTETENNRFKQRLLSFHETDATTKVNTWQDKTETDHAASTLAGKGGLRQHSGTERALRKARSRSQTRHRNPVSSKDDVSQSSIALPEDTIEVREDRTRRQQKRATSESSDLDSSYAAIQDVIFQSPTPSDPDDQDGDYESHSHSRSRVIIPTRHPRAIKSAAKPSAAMERTVSTRSTRSIQNKMPIMQDHNSTAGQNLTLTRTRSGEQQGRTRSERTTSPTVSRRVGLRPNLPKRTYTGESESVSGESGAVPTRRSLRNANVIAGAGGEGGL